MVDLLTYLFVYVSGIVSASKSFRDWLFDGTTNKYTVTMSVQDRNINKYNVAVTLTINIIGYKSKPVFDVGNLDGAVTIAETIAGDAYVYQVQ